MRKTPYTLLAICLLLGAACAQEGQPAQPAPKPRQQEVKQSRPIPLPNEALSLMELADAKLKAAQLERDNLFLQLRLLLAVPNDFIYNPQSKRFEADPKNDKKD